MLIRRTPALSTLLLALLATSVMACGKPAPPTPDAQGKPRTPDAKPSKKDIGKPDAVPSPHSPSGLQVALAAAMTTSTKPTDPVASVSWRSDGLNLPTCPIAEVRVARRIEGPKDVVMEALLRFEAPTETARVLIWLRTDDAGLATSAEMIGDGVFESRCNDGCSPATGICPPPRLDSLAESWSAAANATLVVSGETSPVTDNPKHPYHQFIAARSKTGGFTRFVDGDAELYDAASGRVRHGVSGFVDGLRLVETAFPGPHKVSKLEVLAIGSWLAARYSWEGARADGKTLQTRVAEVVRIEDARVAWSRGYANPMALALDERRPSDQP